MTDSCCKNVPIKLSSYCQTQVYVHSEVFLFCSNLISSSVMIGFDRDFKESYSGYFVDAGMLTPVTHVVFSFLVL